jgi:hypothetical protein
VVYEYVFIFSSFQRGASGKPAARHRARIVRSSRVAVLAHWTAVIKAAGVTLD